MTIQCPKCKSLKWHATGRFMTSTRGLPRAYLKCDDCGRGYDSGLKEALDAGAAERGECEVTPAPEPDTFETPLPQKVLPMGTPPPPREQGFVRAGELAKHTRFARFLDHKARAAGENEE